MIFLLKCAFLYFGHFDIGTVEDGTLYKHEMGVIFCLFGQLLPYY